MTEDKFVAAGSFEKRIRSDIDAVSQVVPPSGLSNYKNDIVISFSVIKPARLQLPVNIVCSRQSWISTFLQ